MINYKKMTKACAFILALTLVSACGDRLTPATIDEPVSTETSVSEEASVETPAGIKEAHARWQYNYCRLKCPFHLIFEVICHRCRLDCLFLHRFDTFLKKHRTH